MYTILSNNMSMVKELCRVNYLHSDFSIWLKKKIFVKKQAKKWVYLKGV